MEKIIDVDFHLIWTSPVFLRLGEGLRERIDGPDAALAQLHNRWPPDSHPEYAAAKRRCVDAITRRGSSELARAAFIEAAALPKCSLELKCVERSRDGIAFGFFDAIICVSLLNDDVLPSVGHMAMTGAVIQLLVGATWCLEGR